MFNILDIEKMLEPLKGQDFIRIKGVVNTSDGHKLMNWVFGRLEWEDLTVYKEESMITFMGRRGTSRLKEKIQSQCEAAKLS